MLYALRLRLSFKKSELFCEEDVGKVVTQRFTEKRRHAENLKAHQPNKTRKINVSTHQASTHRFHAEPQKAQRQSALCFKVCHQIHKSRRARGRAGDCEADPI